MRFFLLDLFLFSKLFEKTLFFWILLSKTFFWTFSSFENNEIFFLRIFVFDKISENFKFFLFVMENSDCFWWRIEFVVVFGYLFAHKI